MSTALSLAPYSGPFTRREAGHLLRRTTFGVGRQRVDRAVGLGLDGTLDRLLSRRAALPPPLNPYFPDDPTTPVGESFAEALLPPGVNVNGYRAQSMRVWQLRSYVRDEFSLAGRMGLFWHNHFGAELQGADARQVYRYLDRFRREGLGSFRRLVEDVTVDPVMLRFLDGNTSRRDNPNENYARELLELFTLGKGEQVGPGDYSTYTEDDVRAIANRLTGWVNRPPADAPAGTMAVAQFIPNRHDPTPRQLSARFGGKVLGTEGGEAADGAEAYREVVRVVFEHPLAAHHLCRKLYRTFVYYDIPADVEAAVIEPLAALLREGDFAVAPVLRRLLGSEHFFDVRQRGALVKSPLDFLADLLLGLPYPLTPTTEGDTPENTALFAEHLHYFYFYNQLAPMLMDLKSPPSVAGWKAWHQSPQYHRTWINASTLAQRTNLAQLMINGVRRERLGNRYQLELLPFIAAFDNPADPNDLLAELAERLLSEPLEDGQLEALKGILIPGLPDFEWTVEYNKHLDDPADDDLRMSVRRKVHDVVFALVTSPEFHLY